MDIVIKINCDNAAFENREAELSRLFREWARKMDEGREIDQLFVVDANGNHCGSIEVNE